MTADLDATAWQRHVRSARARINIAVARELLEGYRDRPEAYDDIAELEWRLSEVNASVEDVDAIPSGDLLAFTLEVAAFAGVRTRFDNDERVIVSAQRLIDRLEDQRRPTTDLLLGLARYQSRFRVGSREREASIERAVAAAQDDAERLRALIIHARFKIDSSDYRGALATLEECGRLLDVAKPPDHYRLRVLVTTGMAYFYSDHKTAERYFKQVIEAADPEPAEVHSRQSISEALHYSGRIALADGRFQEAVDRYTAARRWASKELEWEGYHHLRVAEVLFNHGSLDEARHHISRSQAIFTWGMQRTSGESQLDALSAHVMVRDGALDEAIELLEEGVRLAKLHGFQRGEILFPVELAKLRLGQGEHWAAVKLVFLAGMQYLKSVLKSDPRLIPRQLVTGAKIALGMLIPRSRHGNDGTVAPPVRCPCGEHDAEDPPEDAVRT
jgi:tetratricopeptide (TPR) repeat protein